MTDIIGNHILLDFYGAKNLSDINIVEQALKDAANSCGATILAIKLHVFGEEGGITGVALLAESHITIHSWPENNFVALDIFVCGKCNAYKAIEPLKKAFDPNIVEISKYARGRIC